MTRQTLSRWALLIGALALMFALQGCGGDDNGGLSAEDMARIDAAEAAAAAAQAEAEAAQAEAEAAQAEAEAAKMAAEEAMTDMDDAMPADGPTLADLYEELAGAAIEADLRERVGTEGPLSTTVLKAAIMATAEAYHVDATSAVAYVDDNFQTFEVLQRAAVETILEVLHTGNEHLSATAETAEMVLRGPQGEPGETGTLDDKTIADLRKQIEELQPSSAKPPMPEGAKVIAAGNAGLSSMASTYDYDMLDDVKKNPTATAKKGTYTASGQTGFAGLNSLQAGGDGADVFGSWLEYSHWGYVMGEDGSMAAFSLGMPTEDNPTPQDASKLSATWKGTMTGAWNPMDTDGVGNTDKVEFTTVRGDAEIDVSFSSTGTSYTSAATLSIKNLVQSNGMRLGHFMPGTLDNSATAPADAAALGQGFNDVWKGMSVTKGDFNRKSITMTAADPAVGLAMAVQDRASNMNYLAGRFYGTDGMEVGGVFMENGEVSGSVTATGMADGFGGDTVAPDDGDAVLDMAGTLVGAFGGAREIPELP